MNYDEEVVRQMIMMISLFVKKAVSNLEKNCLTAAASRCIYAVQEKWDNCEDCEARAYCLPKVLVCRKAQKPSVSS